MSTQNNEDEIQKLHERINELKAELEDANIKLKAALEMIRDLSLANAEASLNLRVMSARK